VLVGQRVQASELELRGRTIPCAHGWPSLLLLGREFTHERVEAWGTGCREKKRRLGRVIGPRSPR